jgi:hypothetical protein
MRFADRLPQLFLCRGRKIAAVFQIGEARFERGHGLRNILGGSEAQRARRRQSW